MELKVGMYIRSKDKNGVQYIRKIVELPEETRYGSIVVDKDIHNVFWVSKKNVLKASFNLIDLIKTGDYVNGHKVINIIEADVCGDEELSSKKIIIEQSSPLAYNRTILSDEAIEDIVTKEEFEARKYVVERDK